MSASSGNTSTKSQNAGKQAAGSAASFNVLNINDLYRGKSLEPKPTGSVAKHGMQTIGKIKNLTRIPAPDNSPASGGSVLREKSSSESTSGAVDSVSSGWSKSETGSDSPSSRTQSSGWSKTETGSDLPLSLTQVTNDSSFHPTRTQSGPSQQSMVRGVGGHSSASATPSPGAPWSGDPVPGAPWSGDPVPGASVVGGSYLNPEFPDLDSALSVDPKQSKGGAVAPQLRPQIPPGGANWTQGMVNVGKQLAGNGANGQFPPRGRSSAPEIDSRSIVRNSDLKSVGVLAPSKIEELDKISKESTGPDWSADLKFDFDQKLDLDHEDENYSKNQREKEAVNQREKEAADLELVNSDRPKVEGPHRPLFDPNDSRAPHSSSVNVRHPQEPVNVRHSQEPVNIRHSQEPVNARHPQEPVSVHQTRSGDRSVDDRFKKNVPDNRPLPSSASSSDPYGGNRNFNKSVQQIPPRFQKQLLQGQRQPISNQSRNTDQKSGFEGIRAVQSNYQDSRTSQDSRTQDSRTSQDSRTQDSRTSQDPKTNEVRQGWRSETSNFQILQKGDMAGKSAVRVEKFDPLPAPMGNWADIMDSDSKKEVEPVKSVNRDMVVKSEEKGREEPPSWRSSMPKRVEQQPSVKSGRQEERVKEEKQKEESVVVKRVITKPTLPVKEESKNESKNASDKRVSDKSVSDVSKKLTADEGKNPKILLGPPPSIPAFGGSRSCGKETEEERRRHPLKDHLKDQSRMESCKSQEQKHRIQESGPFPNNRQHPDRRVQYSDHRDNRNSQRSDYHGNRRVEEKGTRYQEEKGTRYQEEKGTRYQDQKAVSQGERRYQEDRRQEDRRSHHEDKRTHHDDKRTHHDDKRTHHEDKRTGQQNDRRQQDDRRPVHHEERRSHNDDRRPYKSEKGQKSVEPDTVAEVWETASENSHKDEKKQEGYRQEGYRGVDRSKDEKKQDEKKQEGYRQDEKKQEGYRGVDRSKDHRRQERNDPAQTKPRSDSNRDPSDKWKQSQPQRSDQREQRSDYREQREQRSDYREQKSDYREQREQRSYERDVNVHRSSQRKSSDSRVDPTIRRRDEKESSRKGSKDPSLSESGQKSTSDSPLNDSVTHSLSKMSLKDKTGSHEGELSDDGFQRVDRSKKRVKTAGEQQQPVKETDPESSHLRKHSKTASRFPKSKPETSSSKLDKLSEEAFCPKSEETGSNRSNNAWNKPLSQVAPTSGAIPEISKIRGSRTGKSGSFEHQDSGVDINSDHPTSTTSSQRSSPGEHARRAAGLAPSSRPTSTTSVTIPKTLNENVGAEESPPPVGTVIFENRNLRAENEALNNKRPDQHQVPQRSVGTLPETRRAITGSASSSNDHKVHNARFEVGHFDASKEGSLKEEHSRRDAQNSCAQSNSAEDLDQKIASVKKVWEDPVPCMMEQEETVTQGCVFGGSKSPPRQCVNASLAPVNASLAPVNASLPSVYESKSPPRQCVNPSLAPGYKSVHSKQVAVAYPMTNDPNHTPSPPVIQPSQINSPPLDPLRHSIMGYPSHVSTPPGHLYNTPAANFYQQFGQHIYPFSGHQNAMSHAFSSVLNQGVLGQGVLGQGVLGQGVLGQGFPNMIPNHYQNPVQYQMQQQMKAEGGGNPMANSLSQNNSYFQHQNHSYYQQPAASMHQQQQQQTASMHQQQQQQTASMHQQQSYGVVPPGHPQSGQQYRQQQQQPVSMPGRNPSLETSNGSSSGMRMNNQIGSGNNSLYNTTSAEVFQKLFLQHQAMNQAATAIVGRGQGQGNAKVSSGQVSHPSSGQVSHPSSGQVSHPSSGQVSNQFNPQQRPMQRSMPSPSSAGIPHQSIPGMNQIPSSSFPQPIQRPTPAGSSVGMAGPSMGMTAQYSQKGPGSKMSNRAGVSGQNVSIDAAKQREDAIRSTEFFFASTRDPSTVDGKTSSEPTSLE